MGILNVTPDSFYDGGAHSTTASALQKAKLLIEQGASIIDVGGESTRPGAQPIECDTELDRVLPIIQALIKETKTIISIDTTKAIVARQAILAGATLINDISGGSLDTDMVEVLQEFPHVRFVVMHSRGNPQNMHLHAQYGDVVNDVIDELKERIQNLTSRGIKKENLIVDPGFCFAKTAQQNTLLLREFSRFQEIGCPIMAGVSRKSFLGQMAGGIENPQDRLSVTTAAHLWLLLNHVDILRVHDVKEAVQALNFKRNLFKEGDS